MNGIVVRLFFALAFVITLAPSPAASKVKSSPEKDFEKNCAKCHHPKRLGFTAPPLIPGYFSKNNKDRLEAVITEGLPATQMGSFAQILTKDRIKALAEYIQTPVDDLGWTFEDIKTSKRIPQVDYARRPKPITDLEEVIMAVERGTRRLAVIVGKIPRIMAYYHVGAVHGGLKFTHSLDRVLSISRDGAVTSFNLKTLSVETQFKAGISSRAIAISRDDQFVAVANIMPANVIIFDKDLNPIKEIPIEGTPGGIYGLSDENSFILSFRGDPELWLIEAKPPFNIKKLKTPAPFEDMAISPVKSHLIASKRDGDAMYVYDYKKGETITSFPTDGFPHLASAAFFTHNGEFFAAVNHIKNPEVTIISLDKMKVVSNVQISGAGFFVRSHSATPYIWAGTNTEQIALIDKNDFKTVKYITPQPGRKASHVEFSSKGDLALVSIPNTQGAIVVYDSNSLKIVKNLPFNDPAGKYNALNKTYPERSLNLSGDKKTSGAKSKTLDLSKLSIMSTGNDIYQEACMGCHHQTFEAFGPSFASIASRRTRNQIRTHILAPEASASSLGYRRNSMPTIPLTTKQLDVMTDYIISFKE